jgi:ABC-type phosphonate transport system ATPase subunit
MASLAERYRPRELSTFIGQDKALAALQRILDRPGFDGDSFWIVGPSGTGKTTLAWIIARRFAKADIDITELDGEACTIDAVREAAGLMRYTALAGGRVPGLDRERGAGHDGPGGPGLADGAGQAAAAGHRDLHHDRRLRGPVRAV